MPPIRPGKIDAALLFLGDYTPLNFDEFRQRLQLVLGDKATVGRGASQPGDFAIFTLAGMVILISTNKQPLGPEGFQNALASPYLQMQRKGFDRIVAEHKHNIFVTVGGDDVLLPDSPDINRILDEIGMDTAPLISAETLENRAFIGRLIVSQLAGMTKPDAIHWVQSDQMFLASEMVPADDPRGLKVMIHPSLYSSGATQRGVQAIGFHAFGAEHLIDRHVIVTEAALPLPDSIAIAHDFIWLAFKGKHIPGHGETLTFPSGAKVRVRHQAASNAHPRPYIELDILKGPDTPAQPAARTYSAKAPGLIGTLVGRLVASTGKQAKTAATWVAALILYFLIVAVYTWFSPIAERMATVPFVENFLN